MSNLATTANHAAEGGQLLAQIFEGHEVRSFADEAGHTWVCAQDVCEILDYQNPARDIARHCNQEGILKRYTLTRGGRQELAFINEPNLLRLVIKSGKPNAERFEKWVFNTILPRAVRNLPMHAPKPRAPRQIGMADKTRAVLMIGREFAKIWPTAKKEVVAAWTLDQLKHETGVNTDSLRLSLPMPKDEEIEQLNATQVGALCGLTARQVNERLLDLGYQRKQERGGYEVTEAGHQYGGMYPYTRNGHSGVAPAWKRSVAEKLKPAQPASGAKLAMLRD